MSHTDQRPFSFDGCESAQQKLAKLTQMFDVGEYRFDDDVAALVDLVATRSLQLSAHLVTNDGIDRRSAFHSRGIIRRDIQVHFLELVGGQTGRTEVASIGR